MLSSIIFFGAGLIGLASAQSANSTTTQSAYPYLVDPNSISAENKTTWCTGQTQSCPLICGGRAFPNTCDPDTLTYTCTCSDGSNPNITQYTTTVPFFECLAFQMQCLAANPINATAQMYCNNIPCGTKSPRAAESAYSASVASAMMTAAPSASSTSGSSAGSSSAAPSASHAANAATAIRDAGKAWGTAGLIVVGVGAFAFAL